jgi:hypothetical protein
MLKTLLYGNSAKVPNVENISALNFLV